MLREVKNEGIVPKQSVLGQCYTLTYDGIRAVFRPAVVVGIVGLCEYRGILKDFVRSVS